LKAKKDKQSVSNPTNVAQTAYGSNIANCQSPNGTHQWTLKIKAMSPQSVICIGIETAGAMSSLESSFYLHQGITHYAYKNNGDIFYHSDIAQEMPADFGPNDKVTVTVHTKERTIAFYRNDNLVQKCSDIRALKYRLAVTLVGGKKGAAVTISEYNVDLKGYHLDDDQKDNALNGGQKKGTRMKRVQTDGSGMVEQLLQLIETQKAEISMLKQEVSTLRAEKKEDELTIAELRGRLGLIGKSPSPQIELKEVDGNAMEMEMEREPLKPYIEWQPEDVLQWVLSVENGRFLQYEHELTQRIMNSHVDGMDLQEMNVNWLGVIGKAEDQQLLAARIRSLIGKESKDPSLDNDDAQSPPVGPLDGNANMNRMEENEGNFTYI